MKNGYSRFVCCCFVFVFSWIQPLVAQEWRTGTYPDGTVRYKGYFENGKPAGEMNRFYPDGKLQAKMNHHGDSVDVVMYSRDGEYTTSGMYIGREKNGRWEYRKGDRLMAVEEYRGHQLDGWSVRYFPSGQEAERKHWKKGMQDGEWNLFYENGQLRLQAFFAAGQLEGSVCAYTYEGILKTNGKYSKGKREGKWTYYNEQGKQLSEVVYHAGQPENAGELEKAENRRMDVLLEEGKKIPDPAVFADEPDVYMKLTGMEE